MRNDYKIQVILTYWKRKNKSVEKNIDMLIASYYFVVPNKKMQVLKNRKGICKRKF
jgi:hypothetical protein